MNLWILKFLAPFVIFIVGFIALLISIAPDTDCVYTGYAHDIHVKDIREFRLPDGNTVEMLGRKVWLINEAGEKQKINNGHYRTFHGEHFQVLNGKLVIPDECNDGVDA